MSDTDLLDVLDLWLDRRQEDLPGFFEDQDEATQQMYRDHAESLALYQKSGGVV